MLTRATIRAFSTEALKVYNDVAKQQFTITLHGQKAVVDYEQTGKRIKLIHTEVPSIFQGKGVGKILAKHAFDYALQNKLDVTLQCTFLNKYYESNLNQYKSLEVKIDLEDNS